MGNSDLSPSALRRRESRQSMSGRVAASFVHLPVARESALGEDNFHAMLTLERRRAERSGKHFALVLIDSRAMDEDAKSASFSKRLASVVSGATRETDIIGWFEDGAILGVIFTEISPELNTQVIEILRAKVVTALQANLDDRQGLKLVVSVYVFPEGKDSQSSDRSVEVKMSEVLCRRDEKKRFPLIIKRGVDIVGSIFLLLVCSPLFAAIALAIKLTSKGPVIFRQERVGQFGTKFEFLKFRTMYTNNDPKIHRDFVQRLIAGKVENQSGSNSAVFKITEDPRVTLVGRLLRKTSLDEFPQVWNVLHGEMSLVGPRPPLPYEFEVYDSWHRRRVLEMKPGVTGLWQVSGRSRVSFDDMVRLDLRYSQRWSLWLDLKILLATPLAVLTGDGAY